MTVAAGCSVAMATVGLEAAQWLGAGAWDLGDQDVAPFVVDVEGRLADLDGDDAPGVALSNRDALPITWVSPWDETRRWVRAGRASTDGSLSAVWAPRSLRRWAGVRVRVVRVRTRRR